jgi:hypothetical protein
MSEIFAKFYKKTEIEVLPGDYILYKKILRKTLNGRVSYVPFKSLFNSEFHDGLIIEWMIELEDGCRRMIYNNEKKFVSGSIFFVRRSDDNLYL